MIDRGRLIELMMYVRCKAECCSALDGDSCGALDDLDRCQIETIADHLIANGVIVLPCRVGDTIYFDTYRRGDSIGVQPHKVAKVEVVVSTERPFGSVGAEIPDWEFGKTVFLTREEAEKALKERDKEKACKKE